MAPMADSYLGCVISLTKAYFAPAGGGAKTGGRCRIDLGMEITREDHKQKRYSDNACEQCEPHANAS